MEFEEYVAARGPALLRFAYVLTRDRQGAEDLVQSALADAFRHWRRVEHAEHPDAYIRKIVVNRHLARGRRLWRGEQPSELIDDSDGRAEADIADAVVERDATRAVLDALPRRARTILVLRYYADLDDRAIAEALGVRESTVRSTASRALATLRTAHSPDSTEPTRQVGAAVAYASTAHKEQR